MKPAAAARRRFRLLAALPGVAFLILLWWPSLGKIAAGGNDFLAFYAGARLAGTPQLYDAEAVRSVQGEASGMSGAALRFIRLPYYAEFLRPLGRLPYAGAYWTFQALSLGALAAFILLWPGDRTVTLLACCWSPAVSAVFANGQDTFFLLPWLAVAARWHERRPAAAGAVLALCMTKFHLFLAVPLALAAQRRRRMLAGGAAAAAGLLAVSFASAGADWPARYIATIASPVIGPGRAVMPNLHGLLLGTPRAALWEVLLAGAALAAAWMAARRAAFLEGMAAALAAGLLASHHAYVGDCVLLIPACLVVAAPGRPIRLRAIAVVLLLPVVYLLPMTDSGAGRALPLAMAALLGGMAARPAATARSVGSRAF